MVRILFVCSGNVGRSQMAEAFYNYFTKSKDAFSAGVDPNTPAKYPRIPESICSIMFEENINICQHKVKLIKKCFLDAADQVFVLCEKELCPDFLIKSNKVTFLKIRDPYKMKLDDMRRIRDEIKENVLLIIKLLYPDNHPLP